MIQRVLTAGALATCLFFIINFIAVAFLGGINVALGQSQFRSTTIEFPLIGLLISFLVWLLVSGRTKESLLFVGSLIVALGVVELGLRIVDHPLSRPVINFNRWYEPSELYGHQLAKNFEGLGPLQVPVKINSLRFRDVEHSLPKPADTIRVLALGDSFTFGWGVSGEQTYLKHLEQNLQHATHRRAETINTGVPGWGLNQYYLCLKEFGLAFTPDIVIMGYYLDDLTGPPVDKLGTTSNATWEGERLVTMRGGPLRHVRLFNLFTYLSDNIKHRNRSKRIPYLNDLQARRTTLTQKPNYLAADPGPAPTAQLTNLLRTHLSRINTLVNTRGASLIIVLIPDYAQLFHPDLQHINRIMESVSRELGISLLDMTPIYESTEPTSTNYFWPLDAHTNEVGHRALAAALTPLVCEHLKTRHVPCS